MSRKKYFEKFGVVEIQQTFYQPPQLTTALKWRTEAPKDFVYTIKAWQLITHPPQSPTYRRLSLPISESQQKYYGSFKPTEEVELAWEKTLEIARALDAQIILFQCPPSFAPKQENIEHLRRFFSTISREGLSLAWEPRGLWKEPNIKELCRELNLIHAFDPFKGQPDFAQPILYLRLHGIGGYKYKYTDNELHSLAQNLQPQSTSYIMFNNTAMAGDAERFIQILC